jgi:hypothetical protein
MVRGSPMSQKMKTMADLRGVCSECDDFDHGRHVRVLRRGGWQDDKIYVAARFLCPKCCLKETLFVGDDGLVRENVVERTETCTITASEQDND